MAVLLVVVYAVAPLRGRLWWVGTLIGVLALVLIVPVAARRLRRVLQADRPLAEAFAALVLLLSLLTTGFASVYFAMNHDGSQIEGLDTRVDGLYFTVTTLSTVGYGDLVPLTQAARVVATFQMLFDLIFIALAVRVFTTAARRRNAG